MAAKTGAPEGRGRLSAGRRPESLMYFEYTARLGA